MTDNRFRVNTGIPREVRKAYIKQAGWWCEYSERFGDGERDDTCRDYRHYVRCTEHEYCHCEGETLILICDRCWHGYGTGGGLHNEIRGRILAQMERPPIQNVKERDFIPITDTSVRRFEMPELKPCERPDGGGLGASYKRKE